MKDLATLLKLRVFIRQAMILLGLGSTILILAALLTSLSFAVREIEPRQAVVDTDTLIVYTNPPEVRVSALQSQYVLQAEKYKLVKGDTIKVISYARGLKKDTWARIVYDEIEIQCELNLVTGDTTIVDTTLIPRDGWILESWKDEMFIEYVDDNNQELNFNFSIFLYGQSGDFLMSIEQEPVSTLWLPITILVITLFWLLFCFGGGEIIKAPMKYRFWCFVMTWSTTMAVFGYAKLTDLLIMWTGKIG